MGPEQEEAELRPAGLGALRIREELLVQGIVHGTHSISRGDYDHGNRAVSCRACSGKGNALVLAHLDTAAYIAWVIQCTSQVLSYTPGFIAHSLYNY